MVRPYHLSTEELRSRLDEMVEATFSDLTSEFLLMPRGSSFLVYDDFQDAYQTLKKHTSDFSDFSEASVARAVRENSRIFGVIRAILGMTSPEWADLARAEYGTDINIGAARKLDRDCRANPSYVKAIEENYRRRVAQSGGKQGTQMPVPYPVSLARVDDLLKVAVKYISQGVPADAAVSTVHRLDKFDTKQGLQSLHYAANFDIPFAVLLYERYLGRPFATHKDAVSELVGEVMENAVELRLREAGINPRKTGKAERIPGFGQAPDFCIPDEVSPAVIIEAKITSDAGTARDKIARIKVLAAQRDLHIAEGRRPYEVVACIDGRGFRDRKEDMRQLLVTLGGKVFTTATLGDLLTHTRIREFVTKPPE